MQGEEGKLWNCKFYICPGTYDNRSHLIQYQAVLDGSFFVFGCFDFRNILDSGYFSHKARNCRKKRNERLEGESMSEPYKISPGQPDQDGDMYYTPKTDTSKTVLINDIEKYNRHLKYRDFGQKHVAAPTARILSTPSLYLKQALLNEKEEDAAGTASVLGNAEAAGIALGNQADKMRIKKIFQDTVSADSYIRAGNIFTKDSLTEAGGIFQEVEGLNIVDPGKVTRGDLKMFRYKAKHADASIEELLRIRRETNARYEDGGRIDYRKLGKKNRLRKQIDMLVEVTEINAFETYGQGLDKSNPQLFTPGEKAVLGREDSILMAHNPVEFTANMALIKKILKISPLAEEFSRLDPEGFMTERDINRLLKGQVKGIDLKDIRDSHLLKGGLRAMVWNKKSYMAAMKRRRKMAGRGTVKRWAVRRFWDEMTEDEEFAGMVGFTEHAARSSHAGISVATKGGAVAGKTMVNIGKAGGNFAIAGFRAVGNEAAAEAIKSFGEGITGAGRTVKAGVQEIADSPRRVVGKAESRLSGAAKAGTRFVGKGIGTFGRIVGNSPVGRAVLQSRAYQLARVVGIKGIRGTVTASRMARRAVGVPFRFFGAAADLTKQWIWKPVAIVIGFIFFLQVAIAALFGGMGGSSAVAAIILDTEEHFNNPDYKALEEMGFQQKYEQSQAEFQAQIDGITDGYAKTLNKKGDRIPYGVNGGNNPEGNQNQDYKNGVTLHFDSEKSNNLEDILSCVAVVMQQQQADHHEEALELLDCFYKSSHTYDYTESLLYSCDSGCETARYFCNEAENGYPSTDMKFAPYLYEELYVPDEGHMCEVDKRNPDMAFEQYAGCEVTGTCFHNTGDDTDNFGRRKPGRNVCSAPEPYWNCVHSCSSDKCSHDCSRSSIGCGGYWYCGGHDHYGCPEGHEIKACFGHVDMEMNIHMKSLEELFELGGVETEVIENGRGEARP